MTQPCLDESTLSDFSTGLISGAALEAVELHLDGCDRCRMIVAGLVRAGSSAPLAEQGGSSVPVGARIGRYVVLERVGVGAMGEVFAADDPQLGRTVALKLLRAGATSEALRSRLLREAQALAKLQHPNVVSVYDVSTQGDQLAVAMEYVSGGSLREWLSAAPRSWEQITDVFLAAGRGLAAAHDAGLVHRDFKPDNVLVSERGEARVTDFGLAGSVGGVLLAATEPGTQATPVSELGAIVGTPAYMAPDQLEGAAATPASDQFSFCVALAEALWGERPFAATTLKGLVTQMRAGAVRPPTPVRNVPGWLRKVVLRGLSPDPAARFATMTSLLEAISRGARSKRSRWLAVAALAVTASAFAGGWVIQARANAQCTGAEQRLTGVWDEPRRGALRAAFAQTPVPYAAASWAAVERALDAYRAEWVAMHTDTCAATRIRGEQPEATLGLRMACLEQSRGELVALLELFAQPDAKTVEKSTRAVAALRPVASCANLRGLEEPPGDPSLLMRVEETRAQLARAKALREVGRYAPSLALAEEVAARAGPLGYLPLSAEAQYELGESRDRAGQFDASIEAFKQAGSTALEAKIDRVAAAAWAQLAFEVGYRKGQVAPANDWAELARAALRRIGGDPGIELHLENNLGTVLSTQGKFTDAAAHYARALTLARRLRPDDLDAVRALGNWASALRQSGQPAEALPVLQEVVEQHRRLAGADHPDFAAMLNNVGAALGDLGRYGEASKAFRESMQLRERLLGSEHPALGTNHLNLGEALLRSDEPAAAEAEYLRAQQIWEKAFGADHPDVLSAKLGRAQAAVKQHHEAVAASLLEPLLELISGPDLDPELAGAAYFTLAQAQAQKGLSTQRARTLAAQAVAAFARAGPAAKGRADEVTAWLAAASGRSERR